MGGERLLDELDPELDQRLDQSPGDLGRPARVGVDADGLVVDRADRAQGLEIGRAADLDLQRRKRAGPLRAFGDERRLVDADREIGRWDLLAAPKTQRLMTGSARATHGSESTASWIAGHRRSAPNRTGSSAGRPVSAAIRSMTRRASASSG